MDGFAMPAVQRGLFATLRADIGLMELVNGVFDQVPDATEHPYVTLGGTSLRDFSTATARGCEITVELLTYSRQGGRKEAWRILKRIHDILHVDGFAVEGHMLVACDWMESEVSAERDGLTYRGSIQFSLTTQEA